MTTFETLGLSENLIKGLAMQAIDSPTAVQEQAIPVIMENKNVVIQSETGTGKTLAYLLPVYMRNIPPVSGMQVIVLTPTHELAMQVYRQVGELSKNSGIGIACAVILGDVNIQTQIEKLRLKPQIIVGTAGRIIELIQKRKISAHTIKTVVIDEADKMFSSSNIERVKTVLKAVMRDTQIIMVSASISDKALKTAQELAGAYSLIKTAQAPKIPENIRHVYIVSEQRDKTETLRKLINALKPKRAIAFINNPQETDLATEKLLYHSMRARSLHGASTKEARKSTLADFASGKLQILIASDIAARGLHFEDVEAIFSVSMPEDPLDYLHRSGRTGRGKASGVSVSIVTRRELPLIEKYQKTFGISMDEIKVHAGEISQRGGPSRNALSRDAK